MDENFRESITNISEFAKKEIAWTKIQQLEIDYAILDDDLINENEIIEQERSDKKIGEVAGEISNLVIIQTISKDEWESLIKYLQEIDGLPFSHKNIQVANKCVGLHNGTDYPSEKQQALALKIHKKAKRENFSYISQD